MQDSDMSEQWHKITEQTLLSDIIIKLLPFTKFFFDKMPWLAQFVNFSIVGVINMILSYAIYAVMIYINVHPQIANQVSFWISVLNGYLLNRFWVFKKQANQKNTTQTARYVLTYSFNNVLGVALVYLYTLLHINEYLFPFISMPITIPLNYCLNRFWVFRGSKL